MGATALAASPEMDTELYVAPAAAELFIPEDKRLNLLQLSESTCKWPIGDPADADFHFCSHEADNGRSYCEFHHSLAYQGVRRRRQTAERHAALVEAVPLRAIAV